MFKKIGFSKSKELKVRNLSNKEKIPVHQMGTKSVTKFLCRECGKECDLNYTASLCLECWQNDFLLKREVYYAYGVRLACILKNYGIEVYNESQEGINKWGKPTFAVAEYDWMEGIHLREDERALFTFKCRGNLFGFPYNGIGLRYLYVSDVKTEKEWAKKIDVSHRLLAVCASDTELYYVTNNGVIRSTDPEWKPIKMFNALEECRTICSKFTEQQIQEFLKKLLLDSEYKDHGIIHILNTRFYDLNRKVFFNVFADGSYDTGYDVRYYIVSKKDVLEQMARHTNIVDIISQCKNDEIPMYAIVENLDVNAAVHAYDTYEPPVPVGYGTIFA